MLKIDTNSILRMTDEVVQNTWADTMNAFENQGLLMKEELEQLYSIYVNENKYAFTHVRVYFGVRHGELFAYDACTAKNHVLIQSFTKRNKTVEVFIEKGTIKVGSETIERQGATVTASNMKQGGFVASQITATVTVERVTEKYMEEPGAIKRPVTTLNIYVPQSRLK